MSIMRLESDALYDEAPPDAPRANGDPDTGVRASLYRGMHRAKRALAGALLGFALVLPERQEPRDLEALDVDGFEEAMRAYDVDHDEGGTDDGGSDDGGGGSDGSGSAASPAAARGPSASGGSRPALKRFGTLKRLEDDEEWAAVTGARARARGGARLHAGACRGPLGGCARALQRRRQRALSAAAAVAVVGYWQW
ncbi:MAG: hypothetical protein J3K34DRAFT_103487 [Monoraphidium minutum]|nr:MAG: hypothetical protein J3K34DRAFT_103487 [Monoraphidium minutum]